ncbi:hypothetical protein ACFVFS_04420 [Kitasatospora sp. NPDC057692]|uniref:hypothetical protein n=1 Tax=Kitasatospora sp. NPDC057692 TaxID=3346215 RepID=UPI0036CE1A0C
MPSTTLPVTVPTAPRTAPRGTPPATRRTSRTWRLGRAARPGRDRRAAALLARLRRAGALRTLTAHR